MNFLGRNHRFVDQNAGENGFERLVRESPAPQLSHGHNQRHQQGNLSFVHAPKQPWHRPHLMSQSALPRVLPSSYSYDSPVAVPGTFRSPQSHTLSRSYVSDQEVGAGDMLRPSLNHSSLATDNSLNSTATSSEHDRSKENYYHENRYGNNSGNRERHFMSRSTLPLQHREIHEVTVRQNHTFHGEPVYRKQQYFRNNLRPGTDTMQVWNEPELDVTQNFIRNSNVAENHLQRNVNARHITSNLPINERHDRSNDSYIRSRDEVDADVIDADFQSRRQEFQNSYEDVVLSDDYEETFQEAFGDDGAANNDVHSNVADVDDDVDSVSVDVSQEPTSLYLWIIKPVPDTLCICVEGKKSASDENFWHSGIVTRRLSEKCVLTESGSRYMLKGNMEMYDALAAGFTRETVDAFTIGFPPDWKNIIQRDFDGREQISLEGGGQQQTGDDESSVHENDVESASEQLPDNDDLDIEVTEVNGDVGVAEVNGDGVAEVNGEVEVTEKGKRVITAAGPDGGVLTITDIDYGSQTEDNIPILRTGKVEEQVLSKWIIKPLATGKGICVVGIKHNSLLWHSSAIETRLDRKRLKTVSGSLYRLKGNMDKLVAREEDVPEAIIKAFHTGFPKEWQELVQEHFKFSDCASTLKRSSIKNPMKKVAPKRVSPQTKPDKKSYPISENQTKKTTKTNSKSTTTPVNEDNGKKSKAKSAVSNHNDRKSGVTTNEQTKSSSVKRKVKSSVRPKNKNNKSIAESTAEEDGDGQFVYTPSGEMVDLESLGRSRSGRLIKPPLQWWTGQKVSLTERGIAITGVTEYAAKYLQEIGDGYKRSTGKWQRHYWNPVGSDRDSSVNSTKSVLSESKLNTIPTLPASSGQEKQTRNNIISQAVASKTSKQHSSGSKTSELVTDSKQHSKVEKGKNSAESSVLKNNVMDPSCVVVLPQLEYEVMNVLKDAKAKQQSKKPTKRDTCYSTSRSQKDKKVAGDANEFDLNETKDSEVVDDAKCLAKNLKGKKGARTGKVNKASNDRINNVENSIEESEIPVHNSDSRKLRNLKTNDSIKAEEKVSNQWLDNESKSNKNNRKVTSRTSSATKDANNTEVELMDHPTTRSRKCKRSARLETISEDETEEECRPIKRSGRNARKGKRSLNTKERSAEVEMVSEKDSDGDEEYVPVKARPARKARSSGRNRSLETKKDEEESALTDHWTKEEKSRLFSACKEIAPSHPHYWQKVADAVRTKSEEACQDMYYGPGQKPDSAKKLTSKPPKGKPKATAITARAGTMKRKQQLRDILDQHNEDYEDDIFDSTPFRNKRKRKVPRLEDEDEDAIFEEIAKKQGKTRFETPVGAGMTSNRGRVAFASEKKTPASNLNLDIFEENPDAVNQVHKILQRRKIATRKQKLVETPKPTKVTVPVDEDSPQKRLFHEYLREKKDVTDDFKDSDMEEDYYWDDDVAAH